MTILDQSITTPCGSEVRVNFNTKNDKTTLKAVTVDSIGENFNTFRSDNQFLRIKLYMLCRYPNHHNHCRFQGILLIIE